MTRARWMWVVVFVAAVGCGGTDADPQQAPPANGVAPDHETLGTWPNVVVPLADQAGNLIVHDQKTAADLLFDIWMNAEGARKLNPPEITAQELSDVREAILKCGSNTGNPPAKIDDHAELLRTALAKAVARDWAGCIGDLTHGH